MSNLQTSARHRPIILGGSSNDLRIILMRKREMIIHGYQESIIILDNSLNATRSVRG